MISGTPVYVGQNEGHALRHKFERAYLYQLLDGRHAVCSVQDWIDSTHYPHGVSVGAVCN